MAYYRHFLWIVMLVACSCLLPACSKSVAKEQTGVVINEIMAQNYVGLMSADGELYDWIELKNASAKAVSLENYILTRGDGKAEWVLPNVTIQPDSYLLLFASKQDLCEEGGELHTNFKLPKEDGYLALKSPNKQVVSEVLYDRLKPNQVLRLLADGSYEKSYEQTPGFENSEKGQLAYFQLIESQRKDALLIWEIYSKKRDEAGDLPTGKDWIELKNVSSAPIHLSDYCLTDDPDKPGRCSLPDKILAPGEIVTFYTGKADKKSTNLYVNFKLDGSESVILTKNLLFVDGISGKTTYSGVSYGRVSGHDGFFYFARPTAGTENTAKAFRKIAPAPAFCTPSGVYNDTDSVWVRIDGHGLQVHYTTDGSLPTVKSPLYKDSILLAKTTVFRAFSTSETALQSPVQTATYLLRENHTLPVVSVTVDPNDLYNEATGICAMGYHAADSFPYNGANFWKSWERPAHIEFFDTTGGFASDCGIKVFGAYSRARDKKSFQIKFHGRYGMAKLHYPFYGEDRPADFHSLVLRSGSQDDNGVMVRDEFFTRIMSEVSPTLLVQNYKPVVLYINGVYWGVYYIREKINEEFVANHLNVDPETISLLSASGKPQKGSAGDYLDVLNYVRSHDLRDSACYAYVAEHVDLQGLMDYKIGEFYTGNCDVGNIRYCNSSDPAHDGRWRWIFYDLDWGFYYNTPLRFYIRRNHVRANGMVLEPYNIIIDKLLDNPDFRRRFLERYSFHLHNTLSPAHATALFDEMIRVIAPEMERNCGRWQNTNYQAWKRNIERFHSKIDSRPDFMLSELDAELHLTAEEKQRYFSDL